MRARFVPLADVAEILSISATQAYALVRSGELPAIQVGGRGQWRVELVRLEEYIERKYAETRESIAAAGGQRPVDQPSASSPRPDRADSPGSPEEPGGPGR